MPRHSGKPTSVPDQTALMFWTTPATYHAAFNTVAVRAYTNLHGDAYGPGNSAQFPVLLANKLESEQPYYLLEQPADWMLGKVQHFVGARPKDQSVADFHSAIHAWGVSIASVPPVGLEGGLLCAGDHYVVAWLLWGPAATPHPLCNNSRRSRPRGSIKRHNPIPCPLACGINGQESSLPIQAASTSSSIAPSRELIECNKPFRYTRIPRWHW